MKRLTTGTCNSSRLKHIRSQLLRINLTHAESTLEYRRCYSSIIEAMHSRCYRKLNLPNSNKNIGDFKCMSTTQHDEDITDPSTQPSKYNKEFKYSTVIDPEDYLSIEEGGILEKKIHKIEVAKIVVLLIKQLKPNDHNHHNNNCLNKQTLGEQYARFIHSKWGIGDKVSQNGCLIFIAVEDRVLYFSIGKGLQQKLTEDKLDQIAANMKMTLKKNDYHNALDTAIHEINTVLITPESSYNNRYVGGVLLALLFTIIALFPPTQKEDEKQQLISGNMKLRNIIELLASIKEEKYISSMCPNCLQNHIGQISSENVNKFPCGHIICTDCSTSIVHGNICPICKGNIDKQEGDLEYIVSSEDLIPSRIVDIIYRIQRLHSIYPKVMDQETKLHLEKLINAGDFPEARKLGFERMNAVEAVVATLDALPSNDNSSSNTGDAKTYSSAADIAATPAPDSTVGQKEERSSTSAHYEGGSSSGGKGTTW